MARRSATALSTHADGAFLTVPPKRETMAQCEECGRHEQLPYQCRRCGETFCADHRLPENHGCPGLGEWDDPDGVFASEFDDSVRQTPSESEGLLDSLTATGGIAGYFRGNVAYLVLGLMWLTFALEWLTIVLFGQAAFRAVFVIQSDHLLRVWTWVTSVFAHSPVSFLHIVGNSIVIYFFGPLVEEYVGSKKFAALFVGSGVLAGLGHMGAHLSLVELGMASGTVGALGASGAAFAILGVLTLLNPSLKVYLYFVLPVPIWLFTGGFALLSTVFFLAPGAASAVGQGNVAHFAHLAGLAVGLAYGGYVRDRRNVPDELTLGGGRGGPGGPGGPGGRL